MPPGPAWLAARRHLAAMASTRVGSSPTVRPARGFAADLSAGLRAPPHEGRPTRDAPAPAPGRGVTNWRVSGDAGSPTIKGFAAGVRRTRVVTWVIFMASP